MPISKEQREALIGGLKSGELRGPAADNAMTLIDQFDTRMAEQSKIMPGSVANPYVGYSPASAKATLTMLGQVPARFAHGVEQFGAAVGDLVTGGKFDLTKKSNEYTGPREQALNEYLAQYTGGDPEQARSAATLISGAATAPLFGVAGASRTIAGAIAKNAALSSAGAASVYEEDATPGDKAFAATIGALIGGGISALSAVIPGIKNGVKNVITNQIQKWRNAMTVEDVAEAGLAQGAMRRSGGELSLAQETRNPVLRKLESTVGGQATAQSRQNQAAAMFNDLRTQASAMSENNVQAPSLYRRLVERSETIDAAKRAAASTRYNNDIAAVMAADRQRPVRTNLDNFRATLEGIVEENGAESTFVREQVGPNAEALIDRLGQRPQTMGELIEITRGVNKLRTEAGSVAADFDRNGLYRRLRGALQEDVREAAQTSPAVRLYDQANARFGASMDTLDKFQGSMLGSLLKKGGTRTPEKFLQELGRADPSVQAYARRVLGRTDPALLGQLRKYTVLDAIEKSTALIKGENISRYNLDSLQRKLFPDGAQLALFAPQERRNLTESAAAISKILYNYGRIGAGAGELEPRAIGRLVGGMNQVFLSGFAVSRVGGAKIEQAMLSKAGRDFLYQLEKTSTQGGATARVAAGMFIMNQLAQGNEEDGQAE